jgi:lipopolysaccharide transport system ATP-binding protein
MKETVLKIEDVSKQYRLGVIGTGVLSYDIHRWWQTLRGKEDPYLRVDQTNNRQAQNSKDFVWALHDINFEVRRGDIVGVIGRNGAGKSTLLKILSRTTMPTTGTIKVKGRIASLLEVGTGFHMELTGRQNIFLNGAILGMTKKEVTRSFDEIVDFSGVEKYLDTPVKRYSSGMFVRLAFAVAAHLESEILIVDEVLAVGDAEFQRKALGKMKDVRKQDRTVLFVSHNMGSVLNLCSTAIFLDKGTIQSTGNVDEQVRNYLKGFRDVDTTSFGERTDRTGNGHIRFSEATFLNSINDAVNSLMTGEDFKLILHFNRNSPDTIRKLSMSLGINDDYGNRITHLNNEVTNDLMGEIPGNVTSIVVSIPKLPLMPGQYYATIHCTVNGVVSDWIQNAFTFIVESGDFYDTGRLIPAGQGNFLIRHNFDLGTTPHRSVGHQIP